MALGQPKVKWIEIDDSLSPVPTGDELQKDICVFIDSEWGPIGTSVRVRNTQEFNQYFGNIEWNPDFAPSSNIKYLQWYLARELSGQNPLVVNRLYVPSTDLTPYVQHVDYNKLQIKQKYPGKFGNQLGIEINYDINRDVIILKTLFLVEYDKNIIPKIGDTVIQLETFESLSLIDLAKEINDQGQTTELQKRKIQFQSLVDMVNESSNYVVLSFPDGTQGFDNFVNSMLLANIIDKLDTNGDILYKNQIQFFMADSDGTARVRVMDKGTYKFIKPSDLVSPAVLNTSIIQQSMTVNIISSISKYITNNDLTNSKKWNIGYVQTLGLYKHPSVQANNIKISDITNSLLTQLVLPQRLSLLVQDADDIIINTQSELDLKLKSNQFDILNIPRDIKGSYVQVFYPWQTNKDFTNKTIDIPPSYEQVKKLVQYEPQVAIQGLQRGNITSIPKVNTNMEMHELLSPININMILSMPNKFLYPIMDEKTFYLKNSQLSRISARRVQIYIEENISNMLKEYLFEPINDPTKLQMQNSISSFLDRCIEEQKIYDYAVEIDDRPELVDNNMLGVIVKFKPMKNLEFIQLNFKISSVSNLQQ